jgi:predicted metal-dependent hydrolase
MKKPVLDRIRLKDLSPVVNRLFRVSRVKSAAPIGKAPRKYSPTLWACRDEHRNWQVVEQSSKMTGRSQTLNGACDIAANTQWMLPIQLKRYSRCLKLTLRIFKNGDIRVSMPMGLPLEAARYFLVCHQEFMSAQLNALSDSVLVDAMHGSHHPSYADPRLQLPLMVHLKGLDLKVLVRSHDPDQCNISADRTIVIPYKSGQSMNALVLKRRLSHALRPILLAELTQLAQKMGVRFNRLRLGWPRSRWGSCSRQGVISLNLLCAFLEPKELHYVLVHELCHLIEPNHSQAFWSLVEYWMSDYQLVELALKRKRVHWLDAVTSHHPSQVR